VAIADVFVVKYNKFGVNYGSIIPAAITRGAAALYCTPSGQAS
jgi:hypothetical protein